jgi:hypothetical protein
MDDLSHVLIAAMNTQNMHQLLPCAYVSRISNDSMARVGYEGRGLHSWHTVLGKTDAEVDEQRQDIEKFETKCLQKAFAEAMLAF